MYNNVIWWLTRLNIYRNLPKVPLYSEYVNKSFQRSNNLQ